jgi:hypothetical protein
LIERNWKVISDGNGALGPFGRKGLGQANDVDPGDPPAFDGQLATPTGIVRVVTIDWKPLLQASVSAVNTRIRIWKNRPRFADQITIGLE